MSSNQVPSFDKLGLSAKVLKSIQIIGYEKPSPIQEQIIPKLLKGADVIGQAQTGTGKTAAFALPLLSSLDPSIKKPQVLVLTPTRELTIQVSEAFQSYAAKLEKFRVLPIYGGQDIRVQLRQLKRDINVVVGTPGRIIDHLKRGTLELETIKTIVLDEADEMLRMGFVEDIEWILSKAPSKKQMALFSATMPGPIRKIAEQHLNNPEHVTVKFTTSTAETINQRYWFVKGVHKLDALTRLLETEDFEAMLVFVRTKTATTELAEKLRARGHMAEALNGDIKQSHREKIVDKLKKGSLDIVVATDVAARGIDVERVSHVINYDIPNDIESYVHRIGRTGRAGRHGEAILFVAPREKQMLKSIERSTKQRIPEMQLPSAEFVNQKRMLEFKTKITEALSTSKWKSYLDFIDSYKNENDVSEEKLAAALIYLALKEPPALKTEFKEERDNPKKKDRGNRRRDRNNNRPANSDRKPRRKRFANKR